MRHRPVVEDATEHVHQYGDDENEAKDASRTNAAGLVRFGVRARVYGPGFEEVSALVGVGSNKGDGGLRAAWIAVAEKRYCC